MSEDLDNLLYKLGIARTFCDAAQNHREYTVDDETLRKMVNYLGFPLKNIADSGKLLKKLENRRWQYTLEPIYVVRGDNMFFEAVIKAKESNSVKLAIKDVDGKIIEPQYCSEVCETRKLGGSVYHKAAFKILSELSPQYYTIILTAGGNNFEAVLAVTPDKCHEPTVLEQKRLWGFAIQLYALNSKRNWGVGDFTDLLNFAKLCKNCGAEVIGVNPLNVLFHDFPENASPYSSISRLFLNPLYIDVEAVDGFKEDLLNRADIAKIKSQENIDYTKVYNLKIAILEKLYKELIKNKESAEYKKFRKFCISGGEDLDNLAVFQTIYSEYCHKVFGGWHGWPEELKNPHSAAVAEFKKEHAEKVEFFKYLQYEAAKQFAEVGKFIRKCGLKIGLYRDLPVGLCKDSVELWSNNDLFIKRCGAGAPPDIFFPKGQKWCLGAFNPYRLKDMAYKPFIKVLRSAMENAGALRIDHVMSLMRLYIIPDDAEDGTYIYYNFEDMLGIVALESYLHNCMVVGESIGNVPDGFIDKIRERGIYSLSVLWAERWNGCGDFKLPQDFPEKVFCSVGTHDMAPLKMRWFGYDIETMYNLKMLSAEERSEQYHGREDERRRLLGALDYSGVWPENNRRKGDYIYGEGYPEGMLEAVEKYMAESRSVVYLAQLEDIFGVEVLQNLPGTDRDKHPNWRRRLPVMLEDLATDKDFCSTVEIINNSRR